MDFSFELYQPKKEKLAQNRPLIEISTNGRIILNKKAAEMLANYNYCMLGYDTEHKALGILPLEDKKTNSFAIRYAAKGAYIGAKKFFKHYNILPPQIIQNEPFHSNQFIGISL